ncbi:hypothetical protein RND81_10G100400 [Saponaria officinalis]|uniref:DUF4220 domain-containing protein n=1 Tax=Saponaria officinalis TaxID=3572 RepID=A0AAW1I2K4_SAPOF
MCFTQAFLLDSKQSYLRVVSSILVFVSLLWFAAMDKRNFYKVDVNITYVLLVVGIALDMCAVVRILLSDWYIIINDKYIKQNNWQKKFSSKFIELSRRLRRPLWFRSISEYNLLRRCFKEAPSIIKYENQRRSFRNVICQK